MQTSFSQPGILGPLPAVGRSITCRLLPGVEARAGLERLGEGFALEWGVLGFGAPLAQALGREIPGLRTFPALSGAGVSVPSTQQACWVMLHGANPGEVFDRTEQLQRLLAGTFAVDDRMDTFLYAGGRDLTGYEDGTESPVGAKAAAAALVAKGAHRRGASFVAVQRWAHDLASFRARPVTERNQTFGRRIDTNEEMADAPESAHVKRAAQESFDPPAFIVRRSMPWAVEHAQGLEFVAYGESLDRYERVLRRMAGLEDGIVDRLFSFSRPVTGGYYWCPPIAKGRLDLALLGC